MIPSPMTWFTVPSNWCTASIISSSTGSRSERASSGSRSRRSSMELLRSAKSTVTVFRSPACAAGEVRIFSARCRGGRAGGAESVTATGPPSAFAHCPQKRFSGGFDAPHFGQRVASGVAHAPQNREPAGLSWWHREHFIECSLNLESLVGLRRAGQEAWEPPCPRHGSRTEGRRARAIARSGPALPYGPGPFVPLEVKQPCALHVGSQGSASPWLDWCFSPERLTPLNTGFSWPASTTPPSPPS